MLGLVGIVVAWVGASGTVVWRHQMIWIAVGVAAAVVAASGEAMWLLSGLGMVKHERRAVKGLIRAYSVLDGDDSPATKPSAMVWARGMTHFHRSGCDVVRGKAAVALNRAECRRKGLRPCGMCQP